MIFTCVRDLTAHLQHLYGSPQATASPEICPPGMNGDITVNCFRLAGPLRTNPQELADAAVAFLSAHTDVASCERIKAFVNITLTCVALCRDTVEHKTVCIPERAVPGDASRHVLIEYSAPNTNKPQHLGHVRNNTLGSALCSIIRRTGQRVTAVNLVNDRGVHICKSMVAYRRYGCGETPESHGAKGDHYIGSYYVKFETTFREQIQELRKHNADLAETKAADMFLDTEIGRAAQDELVAWENGDLDVRALWHRLNSWVLEGFSTTYARLGIVFDHTYFESETYKIGKNVVLQDRENFSRTEDGAVVADLSADKLGQKVLLRRDGTSVYVTQDIGTTLMKYEDFRPDTMIWIVGDEQIHHFKVLFAIIRKMGFEWSSRLHHIPYGMVNLPSGKMKSREGTVVDADDLLDEMVVLARSATRERHPTLDDAELDKRATAIGIGALKFMLLKMNPRTTMTFDPAAAIRFEGDSGPYVQYAHARIASLLQKYNHDSATQIDWSLPNSDEERRIAVRCAMYPEILDAAARDFDPSVICGYLIDLTKDFNRFYKKHSVLSAPSDALKAVRIALCRRVQQILGDGLAVLNIEALDEM